MRSFLKNSAAVVLSLIIAFSFLAVSYAAENELKFGADGKFRIMHVTDTHLEQSNLAASVWAIGRACDIEKPDLVVLTGDNTHPNEDPEKTKKLINALMNIFESRKIPVAVTFGNHDSEGGPMTREDIMEYYQTFSCVISTDNSENFKNCATFNVPVLASDSDKVNFNLWVFDSGDYDEDEPRHYDRVRTEQIEWYKKTSAKLKKERSRVLF